MTDITELAQSLKAAANTTADAIDRLKAFPGDELIDLSQHEGEQVDIDIATLNQWYELSSPDNILALVEALEKAQQVDEELCNLLPPGVEYMDPPDGGDVTPLEGVRRMVADYRQRIAELESRSVTVKQGEVLVTVAGFTGCGKSAIAGEIEIAMKAIGVPVTWDNGDSEKRMTGADWLTAIEMYKPTVRIVEVNIPRAAGIKVEDK
ncbi:TPA: ead/Ea22-like family protein [Klebsiella pneumoniae]